MKTKDDIIMCLVARLKEELGDVCTYNTLYEDLKEAGLHYEAREVEKIANDEYAHAEALAHLLKVHGKDTSNDPEIASLWEKAKAAFHLD